MISDCEGVEEAHLKEGYFVISIYRNCPSYSYVSYYFVAVPWGMLLVQGNHTKKETDAISYPSGRAGENRVHFFDWGLFYICAYLKRISDFSVMFVFSVPIRNF